MIKKISIVLLLCVCCLLITGCSTDNKSVQAINNITETISKVNTMIKKVDDISSTDLVLEDSMLSKINNSNRYSLELRNNQEKNNLLVYVSKINTLNNISNNTITANEKTKDIKNECISRCVYLKSQCNEMLKDNICLNNKERTTTYDLCNNILINLNRINLIKNDLNNEIADVFNLKKTYSSNVDELTSKYTSLQNSLETRIQYIENINNCLGNLSDVLGTLNNSFNEDLITQEVSITPNIDTYENANTKQDEYITPRRNFRYSYPNYNYGYNNYYGYGMNNPYYRNGMPYNFYRNGYGFGGYVGTPMGYGSPYTNYNPYMPNVDTFGGYRNVDSFHSNQYYRQINQNSEDDESQQTKQTSAENVKIVNK